MNLKFWSKPIAPTSRRIEVVQRDSIKLRLAEWRADPKLTAEAAKVFSLDAFRLMLDVLRNENPANLQLPIGTSIEDRSVHQARSEGYNMALANLEAMMRVSQLPEPIEADFQPEELPTQTN